MKGTVVATFLLVGTSCAVSAAESSAARCLPTAPEACQEARIRLTEAEAAVQSAEQLRALWTTAQLALRGARTLYTAGDYEGAERFARLAIEQAQLGIAQARYPIFPMPTP